MNGMNKWQLPHLYALLKGQGGRDWHWQLVDDEGESSGQRYWALVQENATGEPVSCGVYAVGEQLTLQARVVAMVTPALFLEVSERAMRVEDALERLHYQESVLRRLLNRAYKRKRQEDYQDLRIALSELLVLRKLLQASKPPLAQETEDWERQALGSFPPSPEQ